MDFYAAADKVFDLDEGDGETPSTRGMAYRDSRGLWTIGRGHLIGASLNQLRLSPAMVECLFREDLSSAITGAKNVVGEDFYNALTVPRQLALVTLLFTLGRNKFRLFGPTIDLIKAEEWDEVSDHILQSLWAREVDPDRIPGKGRDDRIAYMFRTGEFHPDYGIINDKAPND